MGDSSGRLLEERIEQSFSACIDRVFFFTQRIIEFLSHLQANTLSLPPCSSIFVHVQMLSASYRFVLVLKMSNLHDHD